MAAGPQEVDFIPDRLNEEPIVFLSMTNSEIKVGALVALAVWIPLCTLLGWVVGQVFLGFALSLGLVFVSLWFTGKRLRVIKRGKPKQYHVMAIKAWLQDCGLLPNTLIRESRVWDIKRWRQR